MLVDLDGTLLVGEEAAERCWRSICDRFLPLTRATDAQTLFEAIQKQRIWFWSHPDRDRQGRMREVDPNVEILTPVLLQLGVQDPALVRTMADAYATEREAATALIPGVMEAIHDFRKSGVLLAMVTNGDAQTQRRKIDRFDMAAHFDAVVVEGEFGVGKPDPRVFMHALRLLDARPSEAWMVGDNLEADVGGAQRLGIYGVWVRSSRTVHAVGAGPAPSSIRPDRIIGSVAELCRP